ncbi:LacI family transcriptional regulator [Yersinia pestis]|uniref:HTH-type transcriptional regulator GalR n=12 Tax=Yersinia pseudotuberculosis complex TaxID=1649845 RepID=A0AAX2I1V0_YERPE|nr:MULTISPECIES: LacI family DNA-binding transcriptional regulator [Yersinia pseudotuberculosis complex]EDR32107.1 sugar-binding transcriptional regulator, LacI family [Yersinia pestis biovar Orientalis str. IP275]EFA49962.1 transcriptional regulator, LacI family [Yersinia pestis KIM D27]CQD47683.1 HTH-type transcriptional regulator GalR [Yersinia intermedia]AAM85676.1 repressor of galETK operon [Yersinia pestis KIM10+]AAS62279.1 putative LacI-family transcriptional regulatory protein [Yersini
MATMKDVALRAGVSVATVSRVLNNTAYVEPGTRERVEKAMREYNYQRNAAALALAKRSGNMLGLLTGNLADPFFSRLARGVEEVARKKGAKLMVCSGGHQEELEKAGLDFLINQGCEAIVAHITRMSEAEILRYAAHTPGLVLINRYLPAIANRCVWLDNTRAAEASTHYLLQNGHTRIACVTAKLSIDDKKQRLEGYRAAMASAGITVPADWIISVPFDEEGGELAAEKLLASDQNFTAVVTFNDVMAAGMMRSLHQRNISLPEQLSIVGFDDVVLARYLYPSLTTVHYPIERMARRAANIALLLHAQGEVSPQINMFSADLVIRDSVAQVGKNRGK